ncbi:MULTISPECIES: DUF397 domain-containing protein [unclassified Streptomyces]|uniref:DUF397 domain-containing protein n=1 Tax=unclassified Streptomyces TaxID=2593676 RepID=UPI000DAEB5B3|nr:MULTISPECIES: DUF397 domain-containing protein [unclassified Streptomyces]PZT72111.1 DUF397 domain-containing protein [Streptomyces sp. AC1-42T]PZT81566.1 DUF397 domain-containing protein [Streptomyces sp. AC1-42W]
MIDKPSDGKAAEATWFRSSYSSSGDGNDCVEVAATPGLVLVRDSKDIHRPHLTHAPHAWAAFVAHTSKG